MVVVVVVVVVVAVVVVVVTLPAVRRSSSLVHLIDVFCLASCSMILAQTTSLAHSCCTADFTLATMSESSLGDIPRRFSAAVISLSQPKYSLFVHPSYFPLVLVCSRIVQHLCLVSYGIVTETT